MWWPSGIARPSGVANASGKPTNAVVTRGRARRCGLPDRGIIPNEEIAGRPCEERTSVRCAGTCEADRNTDMKSAIEHAPWQEAMDHSEAVRMQAAARYVLGELSPVLREEYEKHF